MPRRNRKLSNALFRQSVIKIVNESGCHKANFADKNTKHRRENPLTERVKSWKMSKMSL